MTQKPSATLSQQTTRLAWLWLVLLGFLWLQFAGVVHKYVHIDAPIASSQLEQLLPDHSQQNKSDCQLLDLQCGGFALGFSAPVIALPLLQFAILSAHPQSTSSSLTHNYQARAPPASI